MSIKIVTCCKCAYSKKEQEKCKNIVYISLLLHLMMKNEPKHKRKVLQAIKKTGNEYSVNMRIDITIFVICLNFVLAC